MSIPIIIPIPKTRKGAIITMAVVSFVILIGLVAVIFTYLGHQKMLEENGKPDFNTLEIEDLKDGLFVHGTINTAIDAYAERYEESNGKQTTTDLYYFIPIYGINENGVAETRYFISFRADKKRFDAMNNIIQQTWTEVSELTEINLENAKLVDLPDVYIQYLDEWIEAPNFFKGRSFIDWCVQTNILNTDNTETIKSKIVPYLIFETDSLDSSSTLIWLFIGFLMLSVSLLLYLIFRKGSIKGFEEPIKTENFKLIRQMDEDTL